MTNDQRNISIVVVVVAVSVGIMAVAVQFDAITFKGAVRRNSVSEGMDTESSYESVNSPQSVRPESTDLAEFGIGTNSSGGSSRESD